MFLTTMDLKLSANDRRVLAGMLRATTIPAGLARHARVAGIGTLRAAQDR